MSREKLAERAGPHPAGVSAIQRGARDATLKVAARIAKALNAGLPEVLADTERVRGGDPGKA